MGSAVKIRGLNLWYGGNQALSDINLDVVPDHITAIIGASGCGKSTLLRCINRMNDSIITCRITGSIYIDGSDINHNGTDIIDLRRRVGMVFQRPSPFPLSIRENVAFGPRSAGIRDQEVLNKIVAISLKQAALYDEVADRLDEPADRLSGGQQQRLCIARTMAMCPEVILLDEPCSALDPIATKQIENLLNDLKKRFTIIIVTHNMQQAARASGHTAFMHEGHLVEYNETRNIFEDPQHELTERYVTGKFG